jgi:hypothetical protein
MDSTPLRPDPADLRRSWARYASARPLPRRLRVVESRQELDGWIEDLSAGGIGLVVGRPLAVGTLLLVELETCPPAAPVQSWAHVLYCRTSADRAYRLGCQFVSLLGQADIDALLG